MLDLSFTHPQSVVKKSTLNNKKSEKKETPNSFSKRLQDFLCSKKKNPVHFFSVEKKRFGPTQESHRVLGIPTNSAWAVTNLCVPQNPWWKKNTSDQRFRFAVRSQHLQVGVPYMLPFHGCQFTIPWSLRMAPRLEGPGRNFFFQQFLSLSFNVSTQQRGFDWFWMIIAWDT